MPADANTLRVALLQPQGEGAVGAVFPAVSEIGPAVSDETYHFRRCRKLWGPAADIF